MHTSVPAPADLMTYASGWIGHTAAALWPGATVRFGPHVPSVTAYVRRIEVDGRPLFAKVSLLGVSLVSVLRGARGDWTRVKARQTAYTASPGGLLERETLQYGILRTAGLRAPRIAGYADGVLFTEPVNGPTLADLVVKRPHRTADFLAAVVRELEALDQPDIRALATAAAIPERSVPATFARKFNGISAASCVALTGDSAPVLQGVVARLLKLRGVLAGASGGVVFGDLKPEHALFPDDGGRPVFLDPGLSPGHPATDLGKLVSRLVLHLVAVPPEGAGTHTAVGGIDRFTGTITGGMARAERADWLRRLVVLWLMDTVNILTTYLTAPQGLRLPEHARAVTGRAGAVCAMLERTSAALEAGTDGTVLWRLALDHAATAAGR
ncbi:phosphotransferase [Streptomyces sp. JNUCC 64]